MALRYLLSKLRKLNMLSFMSFLSLGGIFVGVFLPVIILSVFSGFQKVAREKILGMESHITVFARDTRGIDNYSALQQRILSNDRVISAIPVLESQGLAKSFDQYKPVMMRGVEFDDITNDSTLMSTINVIEGSSNFSRRYQAILGKNLARQLFHELGERLEIITADSRVGSQLKPTVIRGYSVGFFESGYNEYDNGLIFISLKTLQRDLDMEGRVNRLEIKTDNFWSAHHIAKELKNELGFKYNVYSWQQLNENFFKALASEKAMMWLIVFIVLVVSAINVMGSQILLVLEKKKDIGVLKTLGMNNRHVAGIFLFEGLFNALLGSALGLVSGVLVAGNLESVLSFIEWLVNLYLKLVFYIKDILQLNESVFEAFRFFPEDIYYVNALPVDIDVKQIIIILCCSILLSLLASILPVFASAKMKALEVIRHD